MDVSQASQLDMSIIKILISTVFILIGSTVFYISSLVSGHNIYKDATSLSLIIRL